jgi:hypothetical protein
MDCAPHGHELVVAMRNGLVAIFLLVTACAADDEPDQGGAGTGSSTALVAGQWCSAAVAQAEDCAFDEGIYLELAQAGTAVTGSACEAFEHDCSPVEGGEFDGTTLTYAYQISDDGPDPKTVDASFTLADDGATLTGRYRRADLDVEATFVLNRI